MRRFVTDIQHHGEVGILDMSGQLVPQMGFLRIGDRAAAYVKAFYWRQQHPCGRLIIYDDPCFNQDFSINHAHCLTPRWLFQDLADEIWETTSAIEPFTFPTGENLYNDIIWHWWHNNKTLLPSLRPCLTPLPASLIKAKQIIHHWGINKNYITVQPLWDADYNTQRNRPIAFWKDLIHCLSKIYPVVLLGLPENAIQLPVKSKRVFPLWNINLSAMDSLAFIWLANAHIGGETGTTLWSTILQTPVAAVYSADPYKGYGWFTQPIPFGVPCLVNQGNKEEIAEFVKKTAKL